jgi:hypothetical protein
MTVIVIVMPGIALDDPSQVPTMRDIITAGSTHSYGPISCHHD